MSSMIAHVPLVTANASLVVAIDTLTIANAALMVAYARLCDAATGAMREG